MTFLERYIVPALASGLGAEEHEDINSITKVWQRRFELPSRVIEQVREADVQPLLESLLEISNLPGSGTTSRMSCMVIASTDATENDDFNDIDIMQLAKSASLQRSQLESRTRAILTQLDAIMDPQRLEKSLESIESWLTQLDKKFEQVEKTTTQEPYCIALVVHWRRPQTVAKEAVELVEPC